MPGTLKVEAPVIWHKDTNLDTESMASFAHSKDENTLESPDVGKHDPTADVTDITSLKRPPTHEVTKWYTKTALSTGVGVKSDTL